MDCLGGRYGWLFSRFVQSGNAAERKRVLLYRADVRFVCGGFATKKRARPLRRHARNRFVLRYLLVCNATFYRFAYRWALERNIAAERKRLLWHFVFVRAFWCDCCAEKHARQYGGRARRVVSGHSFGHLDIGHLVIDIKNPLIVSKAVKGFF